jgi:alanyl-tRNA synthetase
MVTKADILKQLQKEPEKYWKVGIFEQEGFQRKVCPNCGKGYWTLQEDRIHCPDPGCGEEYGFIGDTVTKSKTDYIETWKLFEKFFVKNGHASVPRYPVISRWREDLFFNIASIVDFQRFDEGVMTFDYPENPLIVPQMCLRFNDIPNVGITGRHHSCFMMPGQHAFNMPKEGYGKDKCIDLNFKFFTEAMGVPKEELIYMEDLWAMPDFSALGPYIETFSRGLELVNSGYMQFSLANGGLKDLPMKAIDVGWGLERLCWFSNGTPTGYESVFGPVVEKLKDVCSVEYDEEFFMKYAKVSGSLNIDEVSDLAKARQQVAKSIGVSVDELEKKIAPLEGLYAVADHSRALAFAISDGGLPSNVGGGYNLRVILRRALGFIQKFGWKVKLEDVAHWHIDYLKKLFPELAENEDDIGKILDVEEKRYSENKSRAAKIVQSLSGKTVSSDEMIQLYDSQGITPEQLGIETPPDFYAKVTERHMGQEAEKQKPQLDVSSLPQTKVMYYDEPYVFEFDAKILAVLNENFVILDQTAFYPTSGGQQHDMGTIDNVAVTDVFKIGKVIVHRTFGELKSGKTVRCVVDRDRRKILQRHHDAVHVVNGATKKVLGNHVNQAGAEKDVDKARLDITHYEALTEDDRMKIEDLANSVVQKSVPVKKHVMSRSDAERKFGFRIYQGGYVPSKEVRVVEIENFDIEACAGTHGDNTGEIGPIVIIKTKRIADGVVRIELKAGDVAEEYLREKENILKEVSSKLGVPEGDVPKAVEKMFAEWKSLRKRAK